MMKKAGIVIDKWKLSIFERHLREAKREFTVKPGVTDDTLTILAPYDGDTPGDLQTLGGAVRRANAEAAATPPHTPR